MNSRGFLDLDTNHDWKWEESRKEGYVRYRFEWRRTQPSIEERRALSRVADALSFGSGESSSSRDTSVGEDDPCYALATGSSGEEVRSGSCALNPPEGSDKY